jgi:hypothetical protein
VSPAPHSGIGTAHRRRLRDIWRSAGWPCQDLLEVELLAAGLLERLRDGQGRETLRVTDAGIEVLAETLQRNRAARSAHEALVQRVAHEMARAGRIVWCGLSLRARLPPLAGTPARWQIAMPDVYSIRHTTVAAYLQPVVHEIKVRRADLLADLRHGDKRAAYLDVAGECWYVLRQGVAEPDEIPPECGVMIERSTGALEVLRPAPCRAMPFEAGLPFPMWMTLARATPLAAPEDGQQMLGGPGPDQFRIASTIESRHDTDAHEPHHPASDARTA